MRFTGWLQTCLLAGLAVRSAAMGFTGMSRMKVKPYKREALQDIVTWDQHSIFVHNERIVFYSGEFHPFRLPVPGLWLDVFQKIRSMGYTAVSFYVDWALLEGKPGTFLSEGIFALEPFFEAASTAGIYLLARPGPYINAEVSGGGFPGWLQRVPGDPRTLDQDYIDATKLYASSVGEIIAKAQITNGGPVILFQPENELYSCIDTITPCPNPQYMAFVEQQFRQSGIVVPFIDNDDNGGNFAPGSPVAAVDIYGIDSYPLGFDCGNPTTWPQGALETDLTSTHLKNSPLTPFSFVEFQGGSFDPWGGWGFDQCTELLNSQFESVFYKNNFATAITVFSQYMIFGGSNFGNLGHPGGYSSYDYGAVIKEDRLVTRQKFSEAKLLANLVTSSPAYITSTPGNLSDSLYTTSSELSVTPLWGNGTDTNFYILRHSDYSSEDTTPYKLKLSTSQGKVTLPQFGGQLTLHGRDSKVHVTDFKLGGNRLLYSTAEIFTWKKYDSGTVLVVYGGTGEHHELAILNAGKTTVAEGSDVKMNMWKGATVLNWQTSSSRRVVRTSSGLTVYILDRNSAYNYWVMKLPNERGLFAPSLDASTAIIKAGYLIRNATISGTSMDLVGDFNATTELEIVGGAPNGLSTLRINGKPASFQQDKHGVVSTTIDFKVPDFTVPSLSKLNWKFIDSLPEIKSTYDDSLWPAADHTFTNNTNAPLTTPVSLYGADYGFNTGTLLFRGHFTANGKESTLSMETQGGSAFGSSAWINGTYVGSFHGYDAASNGNSTYTLPKLQSGKSYVITVVVDQQGFDENYIVGQNQLKNPRGILKYELAGHHASDVKWKLTGNLGGEDYLDKVRGPLNEGGLWAERQGFHLPGSPISRWETSAGPTSGIAHAGIGWYAAHIDLDMPRGWDIPLSFTFTNSSSATPGSSAPAYRSQVYVNGYQFGKYVHNIGPQKSFPVPEGIWDYHGTNYIAVSLWALEAGGAKVEALDLTVNGTVLSGYGDIPMAPMSQYMKREGAY